MTARPMNPLVSIVVPMLNEQGHIEACLEAFSAQTYGVDGLDVMPWLTSGARARPELP